MMTAELQMEKAANGILGSPSRLGICCYAATEAAFFSAKCP